MLDTDLASMVWHVEDQEPMNRILAVYGQHAAYADLASDSRTEAEERWIHRAASGVPIFKPELHPNTFSYGSMEAS